MTLSFASKTAARGVLSSSSAPISVLVGNKTDLRDGTLDSRGEVTLTEGKSFASGSGCQFFEASAVIIRISLFIDII
jgi:hypothetical protein